MAATTNIATVNIRMNILLLFAPLRLTRDALNISAKVANKSDSAADALRLAQITHVTRQQIPEPRRPSKR